MTLLSPRPLLLACLVLSLGFGCGGSSGISTTDGSGRPVPLDFGGNFIEVEVETTARYLYTLNSGAGTVSAYAFPPEPEQDHHHGHEHGHNHRFERLSPTLSEEHDEHDHDDHHHHDHDHDHDHDHHRPELEAVPGSPFSLGFSDGVDLVASPATGELFVLDSRGGLHRYRIEAETGALTKLEERSTRLDEVRLLRLSADGRTLAVLGDQLRLYRLTPGGEPQERLRREGTQNWNDLYLQSEDRAFAATAEGLLELSKLVGQLEFQSLELTSTETGSVALAATDTELFALERNPARVLSLPLDQGTPAPIFGRFELPDAWSQSQTLSALGAPDSRRVVLTQGGSVGLFTLSPPATVSSIEAVELEREAARVLQLFDSEHLLATHPTGFDLSVLHVDGDSLTLEPQEPFGGPSPFRLTQLETVFRTVVRTEL